MKSTHDPPQTRDDRSDSARIDDLRQQLRSLGYLDAGVDRFVLGPARETRRPAAIAALAAVRVGLIAAVLLGPAVAVGISTRLPGLVTGSRDAAVVALYLGALFGLVVTGLTFVASITVARFAGVTRHARRFSRSTGALVAIGCLVYLTLWWSSANAGLAWSAPIWTAFALAIAVSISLLLGHAAAITAFAVIAAQGSDRGQTRVRPGSDQGQTRVKPGSDPLSSWRLTLVAGAAAFAGAAALLFLTSPSPAADSGNAQLTVLSAGIRIKLIAIDGLDPEVFDALSAGGQLPALSRILGAERVRTGEDPQRDPARSWTTVATGQPPGIHGVHGLETRRVAGIQGSVATGEEHGLRRALQGATDLLRLTRPSIASGTELRAKTVWDVAAEAGLRAAVVNWWATWPAGSGSSHEATVVSDRATLRLEKGGALDAEIAPPQLYERLRSEWPQIKKEAAALTGSALSLPSDPSIATALRRSAELDGLQLGIARRLGADKPDLLAVYFPGLDIAQHALLDTGAATSASAMAARLDALHDYYRFLDAMLRDALQPADDEWVIVVTEPGRLAGNVYGLAGVAGRGATPHRIDAQAVDLAPTILYALGVPVARDLAGRPLTTLFTPEFVSRFPVRYVARYGARSVRPSARQGQPLDQEMIDRLRSLGYVR